MQLTSAGSSDPEGSPLGYFWSMLNKPAGSAADFNNANAANPTFVADRVGTYVAQLIVNDGVLNSAPDTVQVNAANSAPIAFADSYTTAEDTALAVGAATGVLANDFDGDGDPLTAILVGANAARARLQRQRRLHVHAAGELQRHDHVPVQGQRRHSLIRTPSP